MKGFIWVLLIVLILFTSGCTQTGRISGEQNLTPEEEQVLEEFLGEAQEEPIEEEATKEAEEWPEEEEIPGEPEETPCPGCGECQVPSPQACSCDIIIPCNGNGICEEGEYPGQDCPSCNDSDPCTLDSYDYSRMSCIHEILRECELISNIEITEVNYMEEWVEVQNTGSINIDMAGWIIRDTLANPRVVFTFPDFILGAGKSVRILKGYGNDDAGHLYRNKNNNVWNNDGDTAVLIDTSGEIISQYTYGE